LLKFCKIIFILSIFQLSSNFFEDIQKIGELDYVAKIYFGASVLAIVSMVFLVKNLKDTDHLREGNDLIIGHATGLAVFVCIISLFELYLGSVVIDNLKGDYRTPSKLIILVVFLFRPLIAILTCLASVYVIVPHFDKQLHKEVSAIPAKIANFFREVKIWLPDLRAINSKKRCEVCDEVIRPNAKKCKHCGEWIAD
jgi:hypothetical protein